MKPVAFRTQARTIDHLGREQIADCPTAVSELWKNAYDAYARRVELQVFADPSPMAVVFDDGHGMTRAEFEDRWLTIGTASKLESSAPTPPEDRAGLAVRPKQGQKGIGRLSIAHLGPLVVVLSKREGARFVASVVDWRVFENPFLRLEDVRIPTDEFEEPDELPRVLEALFDYHIENVWPQIDPDDARNDRVTEAWRRFDDLEAEHGRASLSDHISASAIKWEEIGDEHLDDWPVWTGERPSGTAMIVLDVYPELACWVGDDALSDDDVHTDVRQLLTQSLIGFVDPYAEANERPDFDYAFVVREGGTRRERIARDRGVDRADVEALEHAIIGEFDESGVFHGKVRAFGGAWTPWSHPPAQPVPQTSKGRVGAFSVVIGAFEPEVKSSSHSPEEHAQWAERAEGYAGLFVYRDHLRLLPYGRPNNDFFRIEYRRNKHAGRHFWAHRRMFGRVAIGRDENPNLKDKAGREGLIENTALRRFRQLVEDFLITAARRFFGTDSPDRRAAIAENKRRYDERARAESKKHRRMSRAEFVKTLRENEAPLAQATERLDTLDQALEQARADTDSGALRVLGEDLEAARAQLTALTLPPRPAKLGASESDWRIYRDEHAEKSAHLERLAGEWREAVRAARPEAPGDIAREMYERHRKALGELLVRWRRHANRLLESESTRLAHRIEVDRGKYDTLATPIVSAVTEDADIAAVLDGLERVRDGVEEDLTTYYPSYIRALERLSEDIDLDTALQWADGERVRLEDRLSQISALAQLGITFEIIGHELTDTRRDLTRNLRRLPAQTQQTEAYKAAMRAYRGLGRRLNFLTPLQMGGRISRERITGAEIAEYVQSFFGELFARERIDLQPTPAFKRFAIRDHRWRIYPVFINLLQNARYWVRQSERERTIMLDREDEHIVVADSGPGVDPEDAEAVFDLFFSRRRHGRGVGLYLARVNLAAGHHTIALAGSEHRVLPGANFVIDFQGIEIEE